MEKIVSSILWGLGFMAVGVILLLDAALPDFNFEWGKWWPVIFVFIGINIIISGIIGGTTGKK